MGLSAYQTKRLLVPAPRINRIVLEITADTAVCLSRFFKTTEQFWLNLQGAYEVSRVKAETRGGIGAYGAAEVWRSAGVIEQLRSRAPT